MEKKTGPVKNENKIPAPIPCNIASIIQLILFRANIRFKYISSPIFFPSFIMLYLHFIKQFILFMFINSNFAATNLYG